MCYPQTGEQDTQVMGEKQNAILAEAFYVFKKPYSFPKCLQMFGMQLPCFALTHTQKDDVYFYCSVCCALEKKGGGQSE